MEKQLLISDYTGELIAIAKFVFVAIILIWTLWIVAEDAIKEISQVTLTLIIIGLVFGFAYFARNKFKKLVK